MDTKLTLKLDKEIIERAKEYASVNKTSLSRIVESYLQSIVTNKSNVDIEISPFVKSIATGVKIPVDLDYKKDYNDYLIQKNK